MHPDARCGSSLLLLTLLACGGADRPPATQTATDSAPAAAGTSPALMAYVTNEGSGEVTIIDVALDSAVGTIPVGTRPRGSRVSPDGTKLYVALSGSPRCPPTMPDAECEKLRADKSKDGIGEIDLGARKVTRVLPGGSDPENFDISQDGTKLFISNEDAGEATFVDVASGKVEKTLKVGQEPEGVKLAPDGHEVWVTGETAHDVTVLDTKSGKVLARIETGKRPRSLVFNQDGTRAYVSSEVGGTVDIVDAKAYKVLKTLKMPEGAKPMGVALSPDGRRLYVANGRAGTVSLVDLGTDSVVASTKVGTRPWGIALTPDGRKLYAANGPSNNVSVLDAENMQVVKTIPAG
ncbi:MAG TPA: beta-propeller fold lactonase family protein, partial [Gemmatimonadales bacterium]|nr:beta-propeller fold lactonase family protein [Gemmatimonadales bacterium]